MYMHTCSHTHKQIHICVYAHTEHIFEYHVLSGENNERFKEKFYIGSGSFQDSWDFGRLKVERVLHMIIYNSE